MELIFPPRALFPRYIDQIQFPIQVDTDSEATARGYFSFKSADTQKPHIAEV